MEELTVNGIECALLIGCIQVRDPLAHDEGKLDLIVQVHTLGCDNRALARLQESGGWLKEEEGLLRPRAVQLLDVVPVEMISIVSFMLILVKKLMMSC